MRDAYLNLVKRYLEPNLIMKEMMVSGEGANKMTTFTTTRASVVYRLKDDHDHYNDEAVEKLHEKIKEESAEMLFRLTKIALKRKHKVDDSRAEDTKDHRSKFAWAFEKLLEIEVIFLTDVIYQSEINDEEGDLYGYQKLKDDTADKMEDF